MNTIRTNIYYENNNQWVELPTWGSFFLNLGALAAASAKKDARLVIAAAIPTRSYAAALSAVGVVAFRSLISEDSASPSEHFQRLRQLKIDTPVSLLVDRIKFHGLWENLRRRGVVALSQDEIRLKGAFSGCGIIDGETWIKVRLVDNGSGKYTEFVRERDSLNIEILDTLPDRLPKRISGKLIKPLSLFARHIIGENIASTFTKQSRLECLIIGRASSLRREIVETKFADSTESFQCEEGVLQDILRVRKFMDEGEHFRSDIFRAHSRSLPHMTDYASAHIVIFDGAISFLRWRDHFRKNNCIVILDHTEPRFKDVADVINQGIMKNPCDDCEEEIVTDTPTEIEIISYYEFLY